jgi:hypothetical protein
MPHHPDLGLPAGTDLLCDADLACATGQQDHAAMFQNLRVIRSEIQTDRLAKNGDSSGVVYLRGKDLQNASLPPVSGHRRHMSPDNLGEM